MLTWIIHQTQHSIHHIFQVLINNSIFPLRKGGYNLYPLSILIRPNCFAIIFTAHDHANGFFIWIDLQLLLQGVLGLFRRKMGALITEISRVSFPEIEKTVRSE
jgi:hypothetical protein